MQIIIGESNYLNYIFCFTGAIEIHHEQSYDIHARFILHACLSIKV